ncbi:MAG: radical SAM protein [bacterium]
MVSWRQKEQARALISQEQNPVIKDPGGRISVALVYPNHYYIGMSNLGFHTIYALLNDREDTVCERVFLPDSPLSPQESLISLETQRMLHEFDIIAFSVSYENDYLNILKILDLARVPLWAQSRTEHDPLVVIGGACAGFNPEPLARFADCFIVGEGEGITLEFMDRYSAWKGSGSPAGGKSPSGNGSLAGNGSREDLLKELATRAGFYIPRFYRVEYHPDGRIAEMSISKDASAFISRPGISQALVTDLNTCETTTRIITPNTEFGDMFLVEISRGCRRKCNFCLMTSLYKPYRTRSPEALWPAIERGLSFRDRIGLISASTTDHPRILQICSKILSAGGKVSVSSLRMESITQELLDCLVASGHKTITLAPEAGSERLRAYLGKNMPDELIFDRVKQIISHGIPNLKLYFMVGLPSETEADLAAIVSLVKKIKHVMVQTARQKASLGRITVNVNCFVPKPLSKFERCAMEKVPALQSRLKFLAGRLKSTANIQVLSDVPKWAFIQGLLARADRRVGEILHQVHISGGNWKKACQAVNLNPEFYAVRPRDEEEILPWDFIRKSPAAE